MQSITESITEVFHHLLKGETGDEGKRMIEDKTEVWPARLLAKTFAKLQRFI